MEVKIQAGIGLGSELMFPVADGVNTGIGVEVNVRSSSKARIRPGVRVKVKVEHGVSAETRQEGP